MEEIEEFLDDNVFYVVRQKVLVDKNIYLENADHRFIDNETDIYYPLNAEVGSIMYSTISRPKGNHDYIKIMELMYGMEEISIDDHKMIQIGEYT